LLISETEKILTGLSRDTTMEWYANGILKGAIVGLVTNKKR
jgi:hypothetical protein